MAKKWNLQDIHPSEERPRRRRPASTRAPNEVQSEASTEQQDRPKKAQRRSRAGGKKRTMHFIIGGVVVIALALFAGVLLSGAEVTIHQKHRDVTVQASVTAKLEPAEDELGYELLTLQAEGERRVDATGAEEVSERAEGTIRITNEFSTSDIRLVKNTRFETSDGKIFKITESAVVPGYTTDENGDVVAGTTEAEAFADDTGETYNIDGGTRLTIPGFEGEPEFEGVYGEAVGNFTGGFEGERYMVNDEELATATESLRSELREALEARLPEERPAGFVVYESAITFTYETLPAEDGGDGQAVITERAALKVPLFKDERLAAYLAENTVPGYEGAPVALEDPQSLTFAYSGDAPSDLANTSSIDFSLRGDARISWTFDHDTLREDLTGLAKSALPTVLSGYPAIEKAEATMRPFWMRSFPSDPEKIRITTADQSDE